MRVGWPPGALIRVNHSSLTMLSLTANGLQCVTMCTGVRSVTVATVINRQQASSSALPPAVPAGQLAAALLPRTAVTHWKHLNALASTLYDPLISCSQPASERGAQLGSWQCYTV
jgi:hypothetical protein